MAEKLVFQNQYINVSVVTEKHLLIARWLPSSEKMKDDDFRKINLLYLDLIEEHKLKYFLLNTTDFAFVITIDTQTWVGENIIPKVLDLEVKRIAFVVSKEMIAQLSIEQTMEEGKAESFTAYFEAEDEASNWLLRTSNFANL